MVLITDRNCLQIVNVNIFNNNIVLFVNPQKLHQGSNSTPAKQNAVLKVVKLTVVSIFVFFRSVDYSSHLKIRLTPYVESRDRKNIIVLSLFGSG